MDFAKKLKTDSELLLNRNRYNDMARKTVLFVGFEGYRRYLLMQDVGLCAGTGYVTDDNEPDYVVFADGHPVEYRSSKPMFISEDAFLLYMQRRRLFGRGQWPMVLYEWDVAEAYRRPGVIVPAANVPAPTAPRRIGTLTQLSLF